MGLTVHIRPHIFFNFHTVLVLLLNSGKKWHKSNDAFVKKNKLGVKQSLHFKMEGEKGSHFVLMEFSPIGYDTTFNFHKDNYGHKGISKTNQILMRHSWELKI